MIYIELREVKMVTNEHKTEQVNSLTSIYKEQINIRVYNKEKGKIANKAT